MDETIFANENGLYRYCNKCGESKDECVCIPTLDATKEADRAKALQIVREATNLRMRASILLRNTDDELTKDFLMHALGADQ